jgi:enoyl-CoA hydratase
MLEVNAMLGEQFLLVTVGQTEPRDQRIASTITSDGTGIQRMPNTRWVAAGSACPSASVKLVSDASCPRCNNAVGAADVIIRHRDGDVDVIQIDRHERRNALDVEHCDALRKAVAAATEDTARAIVITGAGSSFCAGADLDRVYGVEFRHALYAMLAAITRTPVPVLASVNGPAIGAGTQLAIACDLRVAAPSARFAIPTAHNGLSVDPWTIRRLALLAGGGLARAVLIGCESLDADTALVRGLVDRLGDHSVALEWARKIAGLAPLTLSYSKRALNDLFEPAVDDTELLKEFEACWTSEDFEEGNRARRENRQPRFRGR